MPFVIGDLVCLLDTDEPIGIVIALHTNGTVSVRKFNGQIAIYSTDQIHRCGSVETAWDLLAANSFESFNNFGLSTTVNKIQNQNGNTISTLKASRTLFKAYQYIPLIKFFQSEERRILIADQVGLGKTIEAGHILLELAGRRQLSNCLIVVPGTLKIKWQRDMQEKFFRHFNIYATGGEFINHIAADVNQQKRSINGIVTYQLLRSKRVQKAIENYRFDLVICDEAHKMRNSNTQTHQRLAEVLNNSEASIFLTATPVMTSLDNLFNLLKLLQPKRFPDIRQFNNLISLNQPFVRALSAINKGADFLTVADNLEESEIVQTYTIGESSRSTTMLRRSST